MKTGEGRRLARVRSERVAAFRGWMGEEMGFAGVGGGSGDVDMGDGGVGAGTALADPRARDGDLGRQMMGPRSETGDAGGSSGEESSGDSDSA